jgi:chromosomal replication initiator protein
MVTEHPVDLRYEQVWQAVLADLEKQVTRANFETWFRPTLLIELDDERATIAAPSTFGAQQLRTKFDRQIADTLTTLINRQVEIEYVVRSAAGERQPRATRQKPRTAGPVNQAPPPDPAAVKPDRAEQIQLGPADESNLNPEYTFASFVVGGSNRLAHAAAMAVAETPAKSFNPLFFYGGVGLGKTHLLHAIGHRTRELHAGSTILYVSSERFTNDLIKAIMAQKTENFRNRYRSIDVLMVDDIQFIAGKESTQEEFFHTFNELYQRGKQIILSSDRHPKTIQTLDDRLRSRFAGGLIADVQPPDVETRTAILRQKSEQLGIIVPSDVLEYIARRVQSNIRELEGALNKIIALARLYGAPIRMEIAAQALSDAEEESRRSQVTPERVVEAVTGHFKVSRAELLGRGRSKEIVLPRQIAMYLLREETGGSLVEIGQQLGGRDHSTVMHGIAKIEQQVDRDSTLRREINAVRERLYE